MLVGCWWWQKTSGGMHRNVFLTSHHIIHIQEVHFASILRMFPLTLTIGCLKNKVVKQKKKKKHTTQGVGHGLGGLVC